MAGESFRAARWNGRLSAAVDMEQQQRRSGEINYLCTNII